MKLSKAVKTEEDTDKPWNFTTCEFCSYRTKSAFVMSKHVRLHRTRLTTNVFVCGSETPECFECEICEFGTNLKVDLTEHVRVFHQEKEANEEMENIVKYYHCRNCYFGTHSMLVLLKHVDDCDAMIGNKSSKGHEIQFTPQLESSQDVRPYKCKHCDYRASCSSNIRRHVLWKHTDPKDVNWVHCAHCSYRTKEECVLRKHILFKHDDLAKADSSIWLKCEKCDYKCIVRSSLKRHVMTKHTDPENVNWFKCEESEHCVFKTLTKSHLKRHIRGKHTDPKDINWFKCEECSYRAKEKHDLKVHVLVKHGNMEGACSNDKNGCRCAECVFKASTKNYFRLHNIVKYASLFNCVLCTYQTTRKYRLKQHILIKHVEVKCIN